MTWASRDEYSRRRHSVNTGLQSLQMVEFRKAEGTLICNDETMRTSGHFLFPQVLECKGVLAMQEINLLPLAEDRG